jgi:hypothetical protein
MPVRYQTWAAVGKHRACEAAAASAMPELRGGRIIGMTTLTESRDARHISLRTETLSVLSARHGEELDIFWKAQFGHGIDCPIEVEARILRRQPSFVAIQDFLAPAAVEACSRGLQPKV